STDRFTDDRCATRTEHELGLVLIVTTAAERDVLESGLPTERVGHDVMELQECALGTSVPVLGDEGALIAVTLTDAALDLGWDLSGVIRPGADGSNARRLRRR